MKKLTLTLLLCATALLARAQISPGDTNVAYTVNGPIRFSLSQSNEVRKLWLEAFPYASNRPNLGVWIQTNYPMNALPGYHSTLVAQYEYRREQQALQATNSVEAFSAFKAGFFLQSTATQAAQIAAWKAAFEAAQQ